MKKFILIILFLNAFCVISQSEEPQQPVYEIFDKKTPSLESSAIIECEYVKKQHTYFYSINSQRIISDKAPEEITKIAIIPGVHDIKMRFQAKGELPTTVDPFEQLELLNGHSYLIKTEYKPGRGEYPTSTYTARLRMWIIDKEDGSVVAEKIVNGKGDLVAGN